MKMLRFLIAPESIWLLALVCIKYFGQYNLNTHGKYNDVLEKVVYLLPILLIVACMFVYRINFAPKQYLLLRIILSSIVGSHYLFSYCAASHTAGGPGAGMIYIVGVCFTIGLLFILCLIKIFTLVLK